MKIPEYSVWKDIRKRCNNRKCGCYKNYGGRGIKVCGRWNSFANFMEDMGKRPSPFHTIERVNNDGCYEPGNCKWATREEQSCNKRSNLMVEFGGRRIAAVKVEKVVGLPRRRIYDRLRKGWSEQRAIMTPSRRSRSPNFIEYNGVKMSVGEWDKHLGFHRGRMFDRVFVKKWDIERAMTIPPRKSPCAVVPAA